MLEQEKELKAPFDPNDIEWRIQQSGSTVNKQTGEKKYWAMVLAYVNNRAIMDRLDEVFGIDGWMNEYKEAPDGGILCGISINTGDNWITKWDGADKTNIEATKGGLSNSMKRAAVQFGIGRYLYKLESNFVNLIEIKPPSMEGWQTHYDKEAKQRLYWKIPTLPAWARPASKEA